MKQTRLLVLLLLCASTSLAQWNLHNGSTGEDPNAVLFTGTTTGNLDSLRLDSLIIAYKNSQSIPGIASLIVKDDRVIWNNNYGYRHRENQLPVEDSTLFLVASISKTILATAVMQLWENGMIDLDNSINDYLPAGFSVKNPFFPSDTITVKMLMLHTSSIQDGNYMLFTIGSLFLSCGEPSLGLDSFLVNYLMPGGTTTGKITTIIIIPAADGIIQMSDRAY